MIENNLIAGTESGGVGAINIGSVAFVPNGYSGGTRNTIRNNRIGIGPNGENIGPPAGKFAVGIYASTGDTVEGNIIGNFDGSGILVRDSVGNSAEPAQIRNNTITNCGMGVQAAWTKTALVENNQMTNCKAGVVVNQALLDWTTGERTRVENPFRIVPTVGVTVSQNRYTNVTGPKIALTENAGAVFGDGYTPNLRTVPGEGPNHFQPTPTMATATRAASGVVTVTGTTVGAGILDLAAVTASTMTSVLTAQVSGGPYSVQIPADKAVGLQQVSATVTVNGDTSEFSQPVTVQGEQPPQDTVAPTVTVTAPTAGQQIESKPGTQVVIAWQSSDNVGVVRHDVRLARIIPNGTPTLELLASGLAGAAQTFTWNVPENLDIPQAMVNVEAADAAGNKGNGNSGVFTVKKPNTPPPDTEKPVVTNVTLSAKKVKRKIDPTVTISWKSTDNVGVMTQDVLYATDGTSFSLMVAAGLPGTAQSFAWTVPGTVAKTKAGVVKVVAKDAAGNAGEAVSNSFVIK